MAMGIADVHSLPLGDSDIVCSRRYPAVPPILDKMEKKIAAAPWFTND